MFRNVSTYILFEKNEKTDLDSKRLEINYLNKPTQNSPRIQINRREERQCQLYTC